MPILPAGHKHGRLTVLSAVRGSDARKRLHYLCQCDCGTLKRVQADNLQRTHSCGCIKVEMLKAKATHGMSSTPEFKTWCDIRERCCRVTRDDYARYGAKGVTVCQRWLDSFEAFYEDMGKRPSDNHSIDRIDTNGHYEPSNCRWATAKEQRINQNRTELVMWKGEAMTLKDWSRRLGISYSCLHQRVGISKWSIHRAFTTPYRHRQRRQKLSTPTS